MALDMALDLVKRLDSALDFDCEVEPLIELWVEPHTLIENNAVPAKNLSPPPLYFCTHINAFGISLASLLASVWHHS